MSAQHSSQFFWSDWIGDPAVRRLTPAERGLWIDLLALAATAAPTGYVCDERGNALTYEEIGRIANCDPTDAQSLIAGLLEKGVASRDRSGRLFNRRMVRQVELSEKKRRNGRLGASATALKWKAFQAVPGQMPGQVPRHRETPLTLKKKEDSFLLTSSEYAAPREGLAVKSGDNPAIATAGELADIIRKKGWVS